MIESIFKRFSWFNSDVGLLVLRVGVGAIFVFSGWAKAADMQSTIGFFGQVGFSAFWAYFVTAVELLGGMAVLLGFWVRTASSLLSVIMIVAIYLTRSNLALAMTPISILFSTLAILLSGGGKYSLKQ